MSNPYLQIAGAGIGLLGNALATRQNKQDRAISEGEEDPAIRAMRKRLQAQNAQTAMSVAASQQGVNPALAQRNAQQALAQQQVRSDAMTAQANAQSTLQSRAANRGTQARRLNGTLQGLGGAVNLLGTQMSIDDATQAASAPAPVGATTQALQEPQPQVSPPAQITFDPNAPAPAPEGALGLAAPVASQLSPTQAALAGAEALGEQAAQMAPTLVPVPQGASPMGQMQMQGTQPQLTQVAGLGQIPTERATAPSVPFQNGMATPPVQERQLQTPSIPGPAAAPAPSFAPDEIPNIAYRDQFEMLPDEIKNDPINASTMRAAEILRERGMSEQADMIMEELLRGLR